MREEEIIKGFYTPQGDLKDYYQILQVSPSDTPENIKKQWRKFVKKWKDDEEMLKKINEAYEALIKYRELYEREWKLQNNKKKKKKYYEPKKEKKEETINIKDIVDNVKFNMKGLPELLWLSKINDDIQNLSEDAETFKETFKENAKQNEFFNNMGNAIAQTTNNPKAKEEFFETLSEDAKHLFNLVGWNSIQKHMSLNYIFNTLINAYQKGIKADATNNTLLIIAQTLNLHRLGTENKPVGFTTTQQIHMIRSFLKEIDKIYRTAKKELGLTDTELFAFTNSYMGYQYFHSKILQSNDKKIEPLKELLIEDNIFKKDALREQITNGEEKVWQEAKKLFLSNILSEIKNQSNINSKKIDNEAGLKALFLYEFWKIFDKSLESYQDQIKHGIFSDNFSAFRTTVIEPTRIIVQERIDFYKNEINKHANHLLEDPDIAQFIKNSIKQFLLEHKNQAMLDKNTYFGKCLSHYINKMKQIEKTTGKEVNNKNNPNPSSSFFKKAFEKVHNKMQTNKIHMQKNSSARKSNIKY